MTDEQFDALTDEQLATLSPVDRQELVNYWRRKCLAGEASIDMTKRIVKFLRAGRSAALAGQEAAGRKRVAAGKGDGAAKPRGAKAQAKLIDSDALLSQLDGL